ncbi:MAG: protein kinase [Anaerolineae bacterium]|jgi:serine/threonine-protein kinase|nr:protein kinase [Anaerolineae bacterium]
MSDEFIGKTIGGYEIIEAIGQGGMSSVYRARQHSMNRMVALKILPRHLMRDATYLERFKREVSIIAKLEHRNIVPVYDYGEHNGQPFIAMRYMAGGSVDDLLQHGVMDDRDILNILRQVAPALDYAHSKQVLHRDLKPSNILLDEAGGAYITDFGIARVLNESGDKITTQGVVGTPSYMSPEQAQGQVLDGRSDVYSLAVMLFEMATGRRPFENDTPYSIAVMQVTTPPPNPRSIRRDVSPSLETVILKGLRKRREERYQNAAELVAAVEKAIEQPLLIQDDTQRGTILYQAETSPSPALLMEENTPVSVIFSPPSNAPVIYAPPQTGSSGMNAPVRQTPPISKKIKKRKPRPNLLISLLVGSVIGCGLLTVLAVMGFAMLDDLLNPAPTPTNTQTAETTSEVAIPTIIIPTLDPTSQAARDAILGEGTSTPTSTESVYITATFAPVGVRETPTPSPPPSANSLEDAELIYFALRDELYDLYLYRFDTNTEIRLTTDSARNSYPIASPDGQYVAFQSDRDGDFEIYILTISTNAIRQLTNNNVSDRLATWSPNGEWIAYSSDTRNNGAHDLYRVRFEGGEPELLYGDDNRNSHARYSNDGNFIVFTTGSVLDSATWEIAILDLNTREVRYLTDNDVSDAFPSFSPDDNMIIYSSIGRGNGAIYTIPADGIGFPTLLYDGVGYDWGASYSPDGRYVAFTGEIQNESFIYVMNNDGTNVQRIAEINGFYPSWIP